MKHLIIIGVGGFAREVYWHAQESKGFGIEFDLKGFLDGDVKLPEAEYEKLELSVVGDVDNYIPQNDDVFICAAGDSMVRKKLVEKMLRKQAEFITLIHNTAIIHGNVKIGRGSIILGYTTIHDHACIGEFSVVGPHSGLGHDVVLGDFVSIMACASLCGGVFVEDEAFLADGAAILPHARVGRQSYVGARSLVMRRVKNGEKVFGIPALPI